MRTIVLLSVLLAAGIAAELPSRNDLAPLPAGEDYYLVARLGPSAASAPGLLIAADDRYRLVRMTESAALDAKAAGFLLKPLAHARPLPAAWTPNLTSDTSIARLVAMVSQESLARTIRDLEAFRTRYSYRIKCESAAFYLRDRLASLGYAVRLDTYYLQSPTTRSFNVEAGLVGQVRPESIVIACAHYDSYSTNFDSAPGADDNGTGTAAVLELARVLREKQYRWSLKLLCFSGEEQWMKGSYHWVDSTAVPQGLAIAGVYNLDMFGYTAFDTNLLFVTRDAPSAPLAALAESANVWYSLGLDIMNYLDPDCYGDNTPFWERGYRAVFACEDSEWGIWNGSNPHYHTPHDTFVNLNMPQVTRSTRMAAACLATLAAPYDPGAASEDRPLTGPRSQLPGTSILVPGLTFPGSGPSELWSADGRLSRVLHGEHRTAALPAGIYFLRRPGSPPVSRVVLVR